MSCLQEHIKKLLTSMLAFILSHYKEKGHLHGCPMLLPNYEFAPPIMSPESMYLMLVSDLSCFSFCFLEEIYFRSVIMSFDF